MSIQKHASRLIMFFNHQVERQHSTRGSLSMGCALNDLKRLQLNATFSGPRASIYNRIWGLRLHGLMDWVRRESVFGSTSSFTLTVTYRHVALHIHANQQKKKKKKEKEAFSPGHCSTCHVLIWLAWLNKHSGGAEDLDQASKIRHRQKRIGNNNVRTLNPYHTPVINLLKCQAPGYGLMNDGYHPCLFYIALSSETHQGLWVYLQS